MSNLILLIDAILDTYDDPALVPKTDGTTFCNYAVNAIAQAFGYTQLKGLTADQIVAFISSSADWESVDISNAQNIANTGSFLVAGLNSTELGQAHGHVCVIRPGIACYSGKWGKTPRVLNIGAENFIARAKRGPLTGSPCGLNESFIPLPHIYVLKATL